MNGMATPVTPGVKANPVAPPLKAGSNGKMDSVTIAIIVIASVLGVTLIAVIAVASANYQKSKCVKRYYRGEGVRLASAKRRFNLSPTSWSIGTFNRVLPGGATVIHGETFLLTTQDWRPLIARGDPLKIGPQVFMVSKDLSRAFTDSYVPLDTSTSWIDASGRELATPGKLLGASREGVIVYTCDSCELPNNMWTGPRGGAIGYWDRAGVWHEGSCSADCPFWYSPVWMGVGCVQFNGPSPGTLAKVQARESKKGGKAKQDERDEEEKAEEAVTPKHAVRAAAATRPPPMMPPPHLSQPMHPPSHPGQPMPTPSHPGQPVHPPSHPGQPMHPPPSHSLPIAPPHSQDALGPTITSAAAPPTQHFPNQPLPWKQSHHPPVSPAPPSALPDMSGFTRF